MAHEATRAVVGRVMPFLTHLAADSLDQARLLQYLSARAGVAWGVFEPVGERQEPAGPGTTGRLFRFRDRASGEEREVAYPSCLDPALEALVLEEYQRRALARPLSLMAEPLFLALFGERACRRCRWRGPEHAAIHRECRFAGYPINFEPDPA